MNKIPPELYQSNKVGKTLKGNRNDDLRFLTAEVYSKMKTDSDIDQYIVWVQMRRVNESTNYSKLFYCSYVTDWGTNDCSQAEPLCTLPGPLFYVEKDRAIDVAWVHDIRNDDGIKTFATPISDCMNSSATPTAHSYLHRKNANKDICTYKSPTDHIPSDTFTESDFLISPTNIPVVTHIHGLEVRPTFDGNPMSWMGKEGVLGLGF